MAIKSEVGRKKTKKIKNKEGVFFLLQGTDDNPTTNKMLNNPPSTLLESG